MTCEGMLGRQALPVLAQPACASRCWAPQQTPARSVDMHEGLTQVHHLLRVDTVASTVLRSARQCKPSPQTGMRAVAKALQERRAGRRRGTRARPPTTVTLLGPKLTTARRTQVLMGSLPRAHHCGAAHAMHMLQPYLGGRLGGRQPATVRCMQQHMLQGHGFRVSQCPWSCSGSAHGHAVNDMVEKARSGLHVRTLHEEQAASRQRGTHVYMRAYC